MKFSFLNEIIFLLNSRVVTVFAFLFTLMLIPSPVQAAHDRFFDVQSIDTMKFSRDMARDQGKSPEFKKVIDTQVQQIASSGATHVAIATPYDEEFIPFLTDWVKAARKHKLRVWYRGNFAGWEQWFSYPRITREKHTQLVKDFIIKNPTLFVDGDVFTSCPECENGGPGDPRNTGDVDGYREFLISEYAVTQDAFNQIGRKVIANYYSMNGDVAELIMDKETTAKLDGIVTIDHYVLTPEKLNRDINRIAETSGGKIVLGEFGSPIPDIHGDMTEEEQKEWLKSLLELISANPHVVGVNYWTGHGSSTEIWTPENRAKKSVDVLRKYYIPLNIHGVVTDNIGRKLSDVTVSIDGYSISSDKDGQYNAVFVTSDKPLIFSKLGYGSKRLESKDVQEGATNVTLYPKKPSLLEYIVNLFFSFLRK